MTGGIRSLLHFLFCIKKGPFSAEEDETLEAYGELGDKWTEISKHLPILIVQVQQPHFVRRIARPSAKA